MQEDKIARMRARSRIKAREGVKRDEERSQMGTHQMTNTCMVDAKRMLLAAGKINGSFPEQVNVFREPFLQLDIVFISFKDVHFLLILDIVLRNSYLKVQMLCQDN